MYALVQANMDAKHYFGCTLFRVSSRPVASTKYTPYSDEEKEKNKK